MIRLALIVSIGLVAFVSCSGLNRYFGFEDDNLVEEGCEAIIHQQFGISVDLTPESKE